MGEASRPLPPHAPGRKPDFYRCAANADCHADSFCIDNGGDRVFFCKPRCREESDCQPFRARYPNLGCRRASFPDGEPSADKVCNDNDGRVRAERPLPRHAPGRTTDFHRCTASAECQQDSFCIDNGGDHAFFCKPRCRVDADCDAFRPLFPNLGCRRASFADGEASADKICNDNDGTVRADRANASPSAGD